MPNQLENFANFATTLLVTTVSANATSLTVVSASQLPSSGQFRIAVDSEIFLVTAVVGNTLTVIPGYESTTSTGHNSGAVVKVILTAGIMQSIFPTGKVITASGTVNLLEKDNVVEINKTVPANTLVILPTNPILFKSYKIIDGAGNASTYPITIRDGITDIFIISYSGAACECLYNGTTWKVVSSSTGVVAPQTGNFFRVEDYGGKADGISLLRSTVAVDNLTVSHPQYAFKTTDIGKNIWVNASARTVASLGSGGSCVLSSALSFNGACDVLMGTDNTQAFEDALNAASKIASDVTQLGRGADPQAWGAIKPSAAILLGSGLYLVSNSEARFNSGKWGAITFPRHAAMIGQGMGQTGIAVLPGSYGYAMANAGASNSPNFAADERVFFEGFALNGTRFYQNSTNQLGGILYQTSQSNYSNVDSLSVFRNILVAQFNGNGFINNGRGENYFHGIFSFGNSKNGYLNNGCQDSRWDLCNAGGNGWAGFYNSQVGACAFSNCKSFYNGSDGGTDIYKSANWVCGEGDNSYVKGGCMYTACESQESRGSGWLIDGGLNQFSNIKSSDPKRVGVGGDPRPSICAAVHIRGYGTNNTFDNFFCVPALGLDYGVTTENHYGGDYAVYIEDNLDANPKRSGPRGNRGTIYTLEPSTYNVSKLGGPGITNRLNGLLSVDGEYLPTDVPTAPTIASVVYTDTNNATITIAPHANTGGRAIKNWLIEYKLAADSIWLKAITPTSAALTQTLTGLTDGQAYHIRVSAINYNGNSLPSTVYNYTDSPTAPFQITPVTAAQGSSQVYLRWNAPINGGAAITDYVVQFKLNSEPTTWTTFADGTSTNTFALVTGLTNGSQYNFRVSAVNAIGTGTPSPTISATPAAALAPYFDTTIIDLFDPANAGSVGSVGGTLVESISGLSRGYQLTASSTERPSRGITTINTQPVLDFDGTGDYFSLPLGMVNEIKEGDWTAFITVKLASGSLAETTGLLQSNNGNLLAYIRGDNNDIIAKQGAGGSNLANTATTQTRIITIKKSSAGIVVYRDGTAGSLDPAATLISDTEIYLGRVNAYYGQLEGQIGLLAFYKSALSNTRLDQVGNAIATKYALTWNNLVTAPAQVTGLSVTGSLSSAVLNWTAPADNGSAITDYVVQFKLNSEPTTWTTFADGTSTSTTATVTGLTNGTLYNFRVSAVNAIGTGPVSTSVSGTPTSSIASVSASVVMDVTLADTGSYSGTGQTWSNLVTSPADGSAQTAYDLILGADNSATASDPTISGTAGTGAAMFTLDAGDYFTIKNGNTTFLNNLHKTTGGNAFTIAFVANLPTKANPGTGASLFGTSGLNANNHGIAANTGSFFQDNQCLLWISTGSSLPFTENPTATVATGTTKVIVITYDPSTRAYKIYNGNSTAITGTIGSYTSTTNPSFPLQIGAAGGGGTQLTGSQYRSVSMFNTVLSDAQVTSLRSFYSGRHGISL